MLNSKTHHHINDYKNYFVIHIFKICLLLVLDYVEHTPYKSLCMSCNYRNNKLNLLTYRSLQLELRVLLLYKHYAHLLTMRFEHSEHPLCGFNNE